MKKMFLCLMVMMMGTISSQAALVEIKALSALLGVKVEAKIGGITERTNPNGTKSGFCGACKDKICYLRLGGYGGVHIDGGAGNSCSIFFPASDVTIDNINSNTKGQGYFELNLEEVKLDEDGDPVFFQYNDNSSIQKFNEFDAWARFVIHNSK